MPWAGPPTPSAAGCTPSRTAPTTSTATSTTPTSAPPSATSAPSTARARDADAYVLPREELYQKIEETIALGGDQILMQGGNHPTLKLEWYEELLRDLQARYPSVNLHAFSASEIWHFHKLNKLPLRTCCAG